VRTVVAATVLVLVVAPSASAKLPLVLRLSDGRPSVGEAVRLTLRSTERLPGDCSMKLLAIAPGVNRFEAVDAFLFGGTGVLGPSGWSVRGLRPTSRMGFAVPLRRIARTAWRATIRFPRAGRWYLIVPK
jgi:hypothetical protein